MGAWGTAIFSDDFALDVKKEYQTLLAFGTPEIEAFELTKDYFLKDTDEYDGDDDYYTFWLAIAAFQQKYGILLPHVKEKAIEIIDSGKSMVIWEGSDKKSIEKRKQVLQKLKDNLQSPPMPRKKIPKPDIERHRWNIGDIVAGQLVDSSDSEKWFYNKFFLFKVIKINKTSLSHIKLDLVYNEWVYGVMYDWVGDELISADQVKTLDYCPELLQLEPGDIEWFNIHNKKAEGFELLGLNWLKRMIKFTLIEHDDNFMIPTDFKYHLLFGTGGNIFSRLKTHEEYFKEMYEMCKNMQNQKGIDDLNGSMGNSLNQR